MIDTASSYMAAPHTRGGWAVRRPGAMRCLKIGLTRAEAWREARRLARGAKTQAYLFGADGRIATRNDYGDAE